MKCVENLPSWSTKLNYWGANTGFEFRRSLGFRFFLGRGCSNTYFIRVWDLILFSFCRRMHFCHALGPFGILERYLWIDQTFHCCFQIAVIKNDSVTKEHSRGTPKDLSIPIICRIKVYVFMNSTMEEVFNLHFFPQG